MPEEQIFASTNPYSTTQTQGGGNIIAQRMGWCAAASAIWCSNILQGVRPLLSKPSGMRSGILQALYRWDPLGDGQDFLNLLERVALNGVVSLDMYRNGVLHYMGAHPGVYHFSNDKHSMAMDTRAAQYYFYDIENGLYKYDNMNEIKNGVTSRYASQGRVWVAIRCTAQ